MTYLNSTKSINSLGSEALRAAPRGGIASKQAVAALHDVALVLAASILEMADAIDRAALREAMQLVTDVALKHDELGRYGVYSAVDAEEDDIL